MKLGITTKCRECKTDIIVDNGRRKYCGDCSKKVRRLQIKEWARKQREAKHGTGNCGFCSKQFICRANRTKYCSSKCATNSQLERNYEKRIVEYLRRIKELREQI